MSDKDIVRKAIAEHANLDTTRVNYEPIWRRLAELIVPQENDFEQTNTQGQRQDRNKWDSTATLAFRRYVAAIRTLLAPDGEIYHTLMPPPAFRNMSDTVWEYLETVNNINFRVRYAAYSGFDHALSRAIKSDGIFGLGCILVEDDAGFGVSYTPIHITQLWIAEDHRGRVDTVHRKFKYTAKQALQKFGAECPESIKKAAEQNKEVEFEFLHCVKPNAEMEYGKRDRRGMKYSSYYIALGDQKIVKRGGYRTMPYVFIRQNKGLRSPYGNSIAMDILNDLNMLNEMEKTILRAAHQQVAPALLAHEDGVLGEFKVSPGQIIYGGLDDTGKPRVAPLQTGANLPIGIEMSEQKRRVINDACLISLFQIMVEEKRPMTATEVTQRSMEKGALIAPMIAEIQLDFFVPLIERELDILSFRGVLPEMPQELAEFGGEYKVGFNSEANRMMQAGKTLAIQQTLEMAANLAQMDPSVMKIIDIGEAFRKVAAANAVPLDIIRSRDEVAEMEDGEKQMQQTQMMMQAAPALGKTAKDFAAAQQIQQQTQQAAPV